MTSNKQDIKECLRETKEDEEARGTGCNERVWEAVKGLKLITTKMAELDRHISHSSPSSELDNAYNKCLMC